MFVGTSMQPALSRLASYITFVAAALNHCSTDQQSVTHTVSAKIVEGLHTCGECRSAFQSHGSGGTGCTTSGSSLNICIILPVLLHKQPSLYVKRLWWIVLACHSVTKQTFVGFLKAQHEPVNQNPDCPADQCQSSHNNGRLFGHPVF